MKRIYWLLATLLSLLSIGACNNTETIVTVASVTVKPVSLTLVEGETSQLMATVLPDNATDKDLSWSSNSPTIVNVDANGRVTAVKVGTATITATAGGKKGICEVTVMSKSIPVSELTLDKSTLDLVEGDTYTLTATVFPDDATEPAVTWTSSNEKVATVEAGKVKAQQEGEAVIKASAGGKEATCPVTVTKKYIPVESVTLSKTELTLIKGTYEVLTVTIAPEDATYQTPTWTSSNEQVVRVDESGRVSAIGGGSARVTATVDGKQAVCAVTVTVPVTSITLNYPDLSLVEGDTETLVATVTPSDATDKTVTWTTSDASVAQVDAQGKVSALKEGKAVITATAGEKSATCAVTVSKKVIPVSGITLNKNTLDLVKGQSETLAAVVTPSDATDKTVTWTSSDATVATVSGGKVTAVGGGSAVITAKAGDKEATCAVNVTVPVSDITLDKTTLTLVEGDSAFLEAAIAPADATDKTVTWTSSDTGVATVSGGKVTAVKEGEALISARAGEEEAFCMVKVEKKIIPVSSIVLSENALALVKGETKALTATVAPADATDKSVTWTSSNEQVATVDAGGKVTAVGGGSATITARSGDKTGTCAVTVTVPVGSIVLNKTSLKLDAGLSETLVATVDPEDATDKNVTWTSSNEQVATVSGGKVTAVGGGSAVITAQAGEKTATCAVTVTVPVSGITLNHNTLSMVKGATAILTATITPADATDKTVIWSSSSTAVATVDASGKITAMGGGRATITARAGEKTATCTVTVTVPVSGLTLNKATLSLTEGDSETLIATVSPADATNKTVTWSSPNEGIATVDQTGKVTAVKEGLVIIAAKAGNISATCVVTVNKKVIPVESLTLDQNDITLEKGDSKTLIATVKPDNATDKAISWSSSDKTVATVDASGKVIAVGGGHATITAQASNKSASCSVTVTIPVNGITLSKSTQDMVKGASTTLTATVSPADATDKTVTWTSSDERVVTVDEFGRVTARSGGSATITAIAGSHAATCVITVTVPVSSILLNKTSLTLDAGLSETLVATVGPEDATDKTVTWSSSDEAIAIVDQAGKVTAIMEGNAFIFAKAGNLFASCDVTVVEAEPAAEAVDLGLSVKWASCNLGASSPEEYGDYYAWGETEPKDYYDWDTYKWGYCMGSYAHLTKYNRDSTHGNVDNKTVLDPDDDAAHVTIGGKWRMPSDAEWEELRIKCKWKWTTENGVVGRKVTGPNGNSIFLPAAGHRIRSNHDFAGVEGFYWSSSLSSWKNSDYAAGRSFDSSYVYDYSATRNYGQSIRPVCE